MTTPQELARKAYYGAEAVAAAKEGKTLVFSYASPATLKQAKLEALQLKVQERLKAHMPPPAADPYEGLETHDDTGTEDDTAHAHKGESGRMRAGGFEQYLALVVPPELSTLTGESKMATARLVLQGKIQDYQRPKAGPVAMAAAGVAPDYDVRSQAGSAVLSRTPSMHGAHGTHSSSTAKQPSKHRPASPGTAKGAAEVAGRAGSPRKGGRGQGDQAASKRPGSPHSKEPRPNTGPPKKEPPPPEDPNLKALKSSVVVPYVPVAINQHALPKQGLASTAKVIGVVRDSVSGSVMRSLHHGAPSTQAGRVLPSSDRAAAGKRTSYSSGQEFTYPSQSGTGASPYDKGTPVPLVKVAEEDLFSQYKRDSSARVMAAAGLRPDGSPLRRSLSRCSTFHSMRAPSRPGVATGTDQNKGDAGKQGGGAAAAGREVRDAPLTPRAAMAAVAAASQAAVQALMDSLQKPEADDPERVIPGFQAPQRPQAAAADGAVAKAGGGQQAGGTPAPSAERERDNGGAVVPDEAVGGRSNAPGKSQPPYARQKSLQHQPSMPRPPSAGGAQQREPAQQQAPLQHQPSLQQQGAPYLARQPSLQRQQSTRIHAPSQPTPPPQAVQYSPHQAPSQPLSPVPLAAAPHQQPMAQQQQPAEQQPVPLPVYPKTYSRPASAMGSLGASLHRQLPPPTFNNWQAEWDGLEEGVCEDAAEIPSTHAVPSHSHRPHDQLGAQGTAAASHSSQQGHQPHPSSRCTSDPSPYMSGAAAWSTTPRDFTRTSLPQAPLVYDWQQRGPRHRRPTSASMAKSQGIITAYMGAAAAAVAGVTTQSGGTQRPRPQSAGPTVAAAARTSVAVPASLEHSLSMRSFKQPDASVRVAQQVASAAVVAPTRKTTSKDRNGVLTWRPADGPSPTSPTSTNPRPGSATPSSTTGPTLTTADVRLSDSADHHPAAVAAAAVASSRPLSGKRTESVGELEAAKSAKPPADLQYRVLEYMAGQHGVTEPQELLGSKAAAAHSTLTLTPAAAPALQLQPHARPSTAPTARAGPSATGPNPRQTVASPRTVYVPSSGAACSRARPQSSSPTCPAPTCQAPVATPYQFAVPSRPTSASHAASALISKTFAPPPRPASASPHHQHQASASGSSVGVAEGAAAAAAAPGQAAAGGLTGSTSRPLSARPQSAVAYSPAGVPSKRTRPPSAGAWGGGVPHRAALAAEGMLDDESEILWSGSVNSLVDAPGVQVTRMGVAVPITMPALPLPDVRN